MSTGFDINTIPLFSIISAMILVGYAVAMTVTVVRLTRSETKYMLRSGVLDAALTREKHLNSKLAAACVAAQGTNCPFYVGQVVLLKDVKNSIPMEIKQVLRNDKDEPRVAICGLIGQPSDTTIYLSLSSIVPYAPKEPDSNEPNL